MAKKTEVTELKSAIKELNEVTNEKYAIEMRAAEASQAHAAALGNVTSKAQLLTQQSEINIKLAQERINSLSATTASLDREIASLERLASVYGTLSATEQQSLDAKKRLRDMSLSAKNAEIEEAEAIKLANEQRKKRIGLAQELTGRISAVTGISDSWKNSTAGLVIQMAKLDIQLSEVSAAIQEQINLENILGSLMQNVINTTITLFKSLDTATASFRKATGVGHEYNDMIGAMELELRTSGVSAEEGAAALGSLFREYKGFTRLSTEEQKGLAKTSALMAELGVSVSVSTKAMAHMGEALGMTGPEIKQTSMDLIALGDALEIPRDIIMTQYNAVAGELAKYGRNSSEVFKQLAAQSKATGLSVQELVDVSKGFDTFEGAAQSAQKLNAVLAGPYFDTISMMNMNEAERNQYIREQIKLSGVNIDAMNRAEKQMLANAVGIKDVGKAMQFLRADIDVLDELGEKAKQATYTQGELEKATKNVMSLQEKLSIMMKGLAVNLAPILEPLHRIADQILKFFEVTEDGEGILKSFVDYAVIGLNWVADGVEWLVDKWKSWTGEASETEKTVEKASLNMTIAMSTVQDVVDMVSTTWESLKSVVSAFWKTFKVLAMVAMVPFIPIATTVWGLYQAFKALAGFLFTAVLLAIKTVVSIFGKFYTVVVKIGEFLLTGLVGPFTAVYDIGKKVINLFSGKGAGTEATKGEGWMAKLSRMTNAVIKPFKDLWEWGKKVAGIFFDKTKGAASSILGTLFCTDDPLAPLQKIWDFGKKFVEFFWPKAKAAGAAAGKNICEQLSEAAKNVIKPFKDAWDWGEKLLSTFWTGAKATGKSWWGKIKDEANALIAPFKKIWDFGKEIFDLFTGKGGESFLDKIGPCAKGLLGPLQKIPEVMNKVMNFIKDPVGAVGDVVKEKASALWSGAKGLVGLQGGGIVTKPTIAQVGEAGAEAIIPLEGRGLSMLSEILSKAIDLSPLGIGKQAIMANPLLELVGEGLDMGKQAIMANPLLGLAGEGVSAAASGLRTVASAVTGGGSAAADHGALAQVIKDAIIEGFKQAAPAGGAGGKISRNIELKIDRHVLARVMDDVFEDKVGLK